MRPFSWIAASCLIAMAAVAACADTVKTTDGRTFKGLIIKDDEGGVVIDAMIHGIRGNVTLAASDVSSKVKEPLPDGFFDVSKANKEPSPSTQGAAPKPAGLDPESQAVVKRLRDELKVHREDLIAMQKKIAKTPAKTDWHPVRPGEGLGDLMRKRAPEPNPDYIALQKEIKEVQDLIAAKNKQLVDVTKGGPAGQAVVDALHKADAQAAAEKAEKAEAHKRQFEEFATQYDTPEKAADFCVKDLMANGIIKTATRTGVGEVQGQKARWMLTSGQWATASHGVGVAAPGAPLPVDGPARRPGAKGSQVSYTFTFTTQAGLLRENNGYVVVANIDGFWEAWGYDVDGVSAPPYNGRERYGQANK